MIQKRAANERGTTDIGWLQSHHSFSFGQYYNPSQMGFRGLRVINDDLIQGGQGFDFHPHSDMEIITVVFEGKLRHRDNLGNEGVLGVRQVQHMSAGKGIVHSEYNASPTEPVHLYQIWIEPKVKGIAPRYDQKDILVEKNTFQPIVAGTEDVAPLQMNQDAILLFGNFEKGMNEEITLNPKRGYWLQLVRGKALVNETQLAAGDGAAIEIEEQLRFSAEENSEALLFDLP